MDSVKLEPVKIEQDAAGVKQEPGAPVKQEEEKEVKREVRVKDEEDSSESSSDDDDEVPLIGLAKPAAKKAPVKKKPVKRRASSSSSDSSSSDSSSSGSSSSDSDSSSFSDSSDSEDTRPLSRKKSQPVKKKAKVAPKQKKEKKETMTVGDSEIFDSAGYQTKKEVVPLKPTKGANKWWARTTKSDKKWTTLDHNGVLFPPAYEPHGVRMKYDGEPVELTPEQEEAATFYAVMLETDYVKNEVFTKNFFNDWRKLLGKGHKIQTFAKCDFRPIYDHLMAEREALVERRKDPVWKASSKAEKDELQEKYGFALVDGYQEKVGNFRVEVPGLFRGRGQHPKTGKIKARVQPEEITLNIGRNTPIPPAPPGHKWRGIVHNDQVTWLAYYRDSINNDFKYVFLAAASRFKGESDLKKFEKARQLKHHIDKIRKNYDQELRSNKEVLRQRATAIYLIDHLALRVGNEKNTDEVADTVGCCSLRVEHISCKPNNMIAFDFLGKDSMRYFNEVRVSDIVWKNMNEFCSKKNPQDEVFDAISTTSLNEHLKSLMPGLTAKVFRTFNASVTLERELRNPDNDPDKADIDIDALDSAKVLFYNQANKEVAILCNHQRSVPKAFNTQMDKLKEKEKELLEERADIQEHLDVLLGKKKRKRADDDKKKRLNDPAKVKAQIVRMDTRIANLRSKMALKDDTKTVALGTSKINYMDPRITVAWCKSRRVPLEKIFNRSLLEKFPWAVEVPTDWQF